MTDPVAGSVLPEVPTPPLALYRRYRPDTFAQVIGQEHVTEPLQRALVNNRVNHAYLFSGPRGCGKTTSARILARALNCEQGPTPTPCGTCQSCRDLARGGPGSIDVIEIDAASHGGVDDARDLRERAFYAPVHSRYKVYIIDEAHMVTTAGFNALLKLVEEPPPHVKFVFATTEPDKVIGTIRSRTHHYPFRLVPPKVLGAYLAELCEAEGIAVEPAVLPLVVRAGGGSVRDSLSVLDQLLGGASSEGVSYRQAAALLGYTPDSLLDEMVDAFAAGDGASVFAAVDKVIEVGQDPRRFAEDLLRRLRDLVVVNAVPDAVSSGLVEASDDQAERLRNQAAGLGAGELARAAEVIASGLTEMRGTTAPRLYLELMCARVLLPGADVDSRGVHARLDRLERRLGMDPAAQQGHTGPAQARPDLVTPPEQERPARPARPEPAASAAPPARRPDPQPAPVEPQAAPQRAAEPVPAAPAAEPVPAPQAAEPAPPPEQPAQPTASGPAPTQPAPAGARPGRPGAAPAARPSAPSGAGSGGGGGSRGLDVADLRRLWPEVLEEVKRQRRFTWILLSQNSHVMGVDDGVLTLGLTNVGARDSFSRGGSEDVLREALVQVLGVDLRVQAIVDDGTPGAAPTETVGRATRPGARPGSAASPAAASPVSAGVPAEPADVAGWAAEPQSPPPAGGGDWAPRDAAPAAGPRPEAAVPAAGPGGAASPGDGASSALSADGPGGRPGGGPTAPLSAARSEARASIRPTRSGSRESGPDPDEDARRDDTDLDDLVASHDELLALHLGAELIAEETEDR
nr:DNA polymerase III subunit gamma and tau [Auraticoccus cholistanensis]